MENQTETRFLVKGMNRPEYYPDSRVKITSPFYIMACGCGHKEWHIYPEIAKCPQCGSYMKQVYPEKGDKDP